MPTAVDLRQQDHGPGPSPVFVSSAVVQALLDWPAIIRSLQAAYGAVADPAATPRRTVAANQGAWLRCLSAMPPGSRYFGAKLMAMAPGVHGRGVDYVIVLFDRQTSRLAALVDGNLVTGYRTAATSAAALDRLLGPGPVRVGVLGSGLEANMHVQALAGVRAIQSLAVYSPTAANRERFAAAFERRLKAPCVAVDSAEAAVTDQDVVLAAARSRQEQPILFGDWLTPGMTVVSIGSTVPEQREVDVSVVERCDLIVCDDLAEVTQESGDMLAAARAGVHFADKVFSLGALVRGEIPGQDLARLPMFKSIGGGLQDVVVAELFLRKALAEGLVTALPMQLLHKPSANRA